MVRFIISYNNEHLKTYEISEPVITVGRLPENTISIANMGISRRHLRIEADANHNYILSDLNSLNGTYVNNKRVKSVPLSNSDVIAIGKYSIVFELADGTGLQAPAAEDSPAQEPADAEDTVSPSEARTPSAEHDEIMEEVAEATTPPGGGHETVDDMTPINTSVLIETNQHVVYKIEKPLMTIGSSQSDDIFVTGFMISDSHVAIEKKDDGIWISAKKMGGKFKVNGKSVKSHRLEHKDRIEVGKSTFRFMENE